MNETVFCEQCGAAIGASASFCASCGTAQAPVVAERHAVESAAHDHIAVGSPRQPTAPVAAVQRDANIAKPPGPSAHTPPTTSPPGGLPASNHSTVAGVSGAGRTASALARARDAGDTQIVASFWLGWTALGLTVLAFIASSSALYLIGVAVGIGAIVTARFSRQRAQATGDSELVRLSRHGQVTGWIVVGLLLVVLLFTAVFLGSFVGGLSG